MDFSLTEEQVALTEGILKFARRELNDGLADRDEQGAFSWDGWKKCSEMGIPGLPFPKKYGGSEASLTTTLLCVEALGRGCKDGGLVHAVVTQLCCGVQLHLYGNEQQKQDYLTPISKGTMIAAQALTEPDAGSDLRSIKTRARKNGNSYILNGTKIFITNGPIADLVTVFSNLEGKSSAMGGLSCFLIDKEMEGFDRGKPFEKMGLRTLLNGELILEECEVPDTCLLGKEGQGSFIFAEVIDWERALMCACHLGMMQRIMDTCVAYAKGRSQFGKPISKYQAVAHKIADMKVNIELGRLMLFKAGWLKDQKKRATAETSMGKLFVSENLKKLCLEALQIHGAYGYMKEYEIERELRDSIASTIYSGTSEIQRNIISALVGL